jgi:hypothetical protein
MRLHKRLIKRENQGRNALFYAYNGRMLAERHQHPGACAASNCTHPLLGLEVCHGALLAIPDGLELGLLFLKCLTCALRHRNHASAPRALTYTTLAGTRSHMLSRRHTLARVGMNRLTTS